MALLHWQQTAVADLVVLETKMQIRDQINASHCWASVFT
jgi:hypothetical protein